MYAHLCKGLTRCNARMFNEILRPYAGIIRIRFMGMISASVTRAPLQLLYFAANICKNVVHLLDEYRWCVLIRKKPQRLIMQ